VTEIARFLQSFECFYKLPNGIAPLPLPINVGMMDKFPLTSVGVSELQRMLYSLGDKELRAEAESLAADPLAWIAGYIEMEVHQLECLRSIEESFMQMLGWNIAVALLGRRPITFSYRHVKESNVANEKPCLLYNCRVTSHVADNIITATGNLDIVYNG
jgi:hypothetical protein